MILTVRRQSNVFVCPDKPKDPKAFEEASKGLKTPPVKKQPQVRIPRGGMRGRSMRYG